MSLPFSFLGMAWVAEGIDEEEDEVTRSNDIGDQGPSTSESQPSEHMALKKLSVIVESSCSVVLEQEEASSEFASSHDVIV